MKHTEDIHVLQDLCKKSRRDIVSMIYIAGSGHPGGSLSSTELIVTLFNSILKHDPSNPQDKHRDRFVLSKGHCTPIYYSVLARCGYFDVQELQNFRRVNSRLQGHPDKSKFDLMETTTGSLGQGLSIAAGKALALKLDNIHSKVYCMIGDGELDEGQIWESLATIKKYNWSNLIIIVDHNNIQLDGTNKEIKNLDPLDQKFKAFGYEVLEVDGHNIYEVLATYHYAKKISDENKNVIIIAHTIKGKGISFMENTAEWHGKAPNKEQYEKAMGELQ
ncbi:MAG TPA: transketolase [Alphaproteobacteria bacterium]|nr:transketolase [Alphaproteobacteria bacterium]